MLVLDGVIALVDNIWWCRLVGLVPRVTRWLTLCGNSNRYLFWVLPFLPWLYLFLCLSPGRLLCRWRRLSHLFVGIVFFCAPKRCLTKWFYSGCLVSSAPWCNLPGPLLPLRPVTASALCHFVCVSRGSWWACSAQLTLTHWAYSCFVHSCNPVRHRFPWHTE